jgi:tetratricopeptide (TPR) repeat protein
MNKKKNLIMVIFLLAGVSFLFSSLIQQETAKELFERALYLEETKGDLEKAIDVYMQVVNEFPEERIVNAKALLHIGICYEKMGKKEAQKAYQKVIDNYPEQTDAVKIAKERIAALSKALEKVPRKPSFRKIRIPANPGNGVLSPDGKKLAFSSEGCLWVVPIPGKVDPDIAGAPIKLTEQIGANNTGNILSWSADGKWIAFNALGNEGVETYIIPSSAYHPTGKFWLLFRMRKKNQIKLKKITFILFLWREGLQKN